MTPLLEIEGLTRTFGGVVAVTGLDLSVGRGEVRGLIGPNGSGKSTLFNLISGVYRPTAVRHIVFDGEDIANWKAHDIAARGISRTFQLLRLFSGMSVIENLLVGCHIRVAYGIAPAIFGTGRMRAEDRALRAQMEQLLEFLGLLDYADMPASEMSIGQRRLLALGRAIAMRPKLLLLDEPASGLSPPNVDNLVRIIFELKQRYDLTVIIIEHIMKVVMESCDIVTVLDHGRKIAEGPPAEIQEHEEVIQAYLGKEMDDAHVRSLFHNA
jgi:branched-chain amino acid transport system ATP-binding protein